MIGTTIWMLLAAPAAAVDAPPLVTHYEATSAAVEATERGPSAELAMASDVFDRMTVPVGVGAGGPYQFLVDTASSRTSVSSRLVRQLGLEERQGATLHSSTGSTQVHMAYLPELRLGARSVQHITAPMLEAQNMGADGILGIDSLRSQRVVFDFSAGTLSILSGDASPPIEEGAIIVRAKRREGRLVITDANVDGVKVTVIVDTGSALTVGNAALRRRLERHGGIQVTGATDLVSVTGAALRGDVVNSKAIEIGGARLEGLNLVFAEAHTFGLLGLDRKPALLLGMDALRGFEQVSIDFAGRTLRLVLPRERKPGKA